MQPVEPSPQESMMKFILGKWISKPISVAAELGLADLLSPGPQSIEELAEQTGAHAPSLYRVMRALACLGIFSEREGGRFEQTPLSACLTSDALRPIARMMHADWHDRAWDHLLASVRTGETAFDAAHGLPAFDYFDQHPEAARIFQQANAIKAVTSHRVLVDAYDFSGIRSLTDVGGGSGALLAEILKAHPSLTGVVADRPSLVPAAREFIRGQGLEARCHAAPCDFFVEIPTGGEAYLLSHVLHDWDDPACLKILKNCRRAMMSGGKLLIVEAIVPKGNAFSIAKLMDLEVFVMGGGRERTEKEFQDLLASAGFKLSRIVPTPKSVAIIEAARVN